MTRPPKSRNPIAKVVTRIPARVMPDKRQEQSNSADDEEPGPLDDLMPQHPFFAAAWAGSLRYALTRDDVMGAFRADTGNLWEPGRTPINRMIDQATGADLEFMRAFAKWHNENIWGEEDGRPMELNDETKPERAEGEL